MVHRELKLVSRKLKLVLRKAEIGAKETKYGVHFQAQAWPGNEPGLDWELPGLA